MNQLAHAFSPAEEAFYPCSDGQPMPDAGYQFESVAYGFMALRTFYHDKPFGCVGGDQFVYYEQGNRNARVAPDVFVSLGARSGLRDVFLLWEEAALDFVMEVASQSTHRYDSAGKRDLYASLGVGEYWQYDPGGRYLEPVLQGFRLRGGVYESLPGAMVRDGGLAVHSEVLGLDVCATDRGLRFFDSVKGEYLRSYGEAETDRQAAEAALEAAEDRVAELEAQIRALSGTPPPPKDPWETGRT